MTKLIYPNSSYNPKVETPFYKHTVIPTLCIPMWKMFLEHFYRFWRKQTLKMRNEKSTSMGISTLIKKQENSDISLAPNDQRNTTSGQELPICTQAQAERVVVDNHSVR